MPGAELIIDFLDKPFGHRDKHDASGDTPDASGNDFMKHYVKRCPKDRANSCDSNGVFLGHHISPFI